MFTGGLKLCEFPIAIKREINRPHSSVFRIVEYERATRYGDSRGQGQSGVPVLENISYGQLQALSAVPRDNPALLGVPTEETASGSGGGSYVITPPRITAGSGVTKRFGSAGRVHVVPVHSGWFNFPALVRVYQYHCINFILPFFYNDWKVGILLRFDCRMIEFGLIGLQPNRLFFLHMHYIPNCSQTRTEFQILLNDWIVNINEEC